MRSAPGRASSPGALDSSAPVHAARRAVGWVFATNGFAIASWLARVPAIRDELGVRPAELGLILLGLSAGAVSALPLSGALVHRVGAARAVQLGALLDALGLAAAGLTRTVPVLFVALFAYGVGSSSWDVAMNVAGAQVERELGRPVMPRFHAAFSLGTVAGALAGSAAAALGLPVRVHLVLAAVLVLGITLDAPRRFRPDEHRPDQVPASVPRPRRSSGSLAAWRERRTLVIGLLVLGMAFGEGVANDWLALGLVDGYRVGHAVAAAGFGLFVAAMTTGRMLGPWALERWGRVPVLRAEAGLLLLGVLLVVFAPWLALAALGAVVWGIGGALGFPVGMSAAADEPAVAAARVSVVATIGYTAFLAGPPLLGALGNRFGVLSALLAVAPAMLLALLAAGAAAPPAGPGGVRREHAASVGE